MAFLRGVGLPDNLIDYLPSLLNQPIQFYSCFISYSSKDQAFAERLHADLQAKGVRCWFAPHDMPIGAKILDAIDEAIRLRDKVLLILSEERDRQRLGRGRGDARPWTRSGSASGSCCSRSGIDDAVMEDQGGLGAAAAGPAQHRRLHPLEGPRRLQKGLERLLRDLKVEAEHPA